MNQLKKILLFAIIALNIVVTYGQEIRELDFKGLDPEFIELKQTLEEINSTEDNTSIELSLNALEKFKDESIRFDLMVWELSIHYANLKQYDKCFDILKLGQQEGFFYYIRGGDQAFPLYITELEVFPIYNTATFQKNLKVNSLSHISREALSGQGHKEASKCKNGNQKSSKVMTK